VNPSQPKVAVVGHIEWVRFARVGHVPRAGEVIHAREPFEEPAGGGAVAAVQLARLAGDCALITAVGDDDHGRRSLVRLRELGVHVWAATRAEATRTAVTLVDDDGERTITTFGARLEPAGSDEQLPWSVLGGMDGVYFTAGDSGALRAARAARVLVASPRAVHALGHGLRLDALVLSEGDEVERRESSRTQNDAGLVVLTEGERGGAYKERGGHWASWPAQSPPAAPIDSYGCGDSFAAGLTYGLGAGLTAADALTLAARCGAVCLTGRGPYQRQLTGEDLRGASGDGS
jgi:ribokinase